MDTYAPDGVASSAFGLGATLARQPASRTPKRRFSLRLILGLDEVSDVHRHLLNLSVVELLDVAQEAHIGLSEEVDSNSLTAETATAADTVDVVLAVRREVEVNHERNLRKSKNGREKNQSRGRERACNELCPCWNGTGQDDAW